MKLFFFGILFAHKTNHGFVEVHGDVMHYDYKGAKSAATVYGVEMLRKSNDKGLFIVGTTVKEAETVVVTNNV